MELTLTVDEAVIERAKRYAEERHQNLSALVESYLDRIARPEAPLIPQDLHSPLVESLVGIIPDDGRDYKELLDEALTDKYLRKGIRLV